MASVIDLIISATSLPPSNFTASAPASINFNEFSTASFFVLYELIGKSETINEFFLPFFAAVVNLIMSSIVTEDVFSYPNMTIPALSPTKITST